MSPPHDLPIRRNFHSTPNTLATPTSLATPAPTPAPAQILDIFDAPTRLGYRPIPPPPPSYSTPPSHHKPSFMPRPRPLPRPLPLPIVFDGPAYTVASITPRTQLHTMPAVELFDGPARIRRVVPVRRAVPMRLGWLPGIVVGGAAAYGAKVLLL
ncbi:hypothetical protein Hypma_001740 [Hypsizygus marmoreus]|uniref:Uncharacterized protein n=1 Tax=Hypsizygus marmoreus TaxID=39966 RepID=A0A369JED7_HYPMA|nr:hypothetical protein Hypma_001740 [Hypsizygus marmoreus]